MILAGINFTLHYHALRGQVWMYWRSQEFRFYLAITIIAVLILAFFNWGQRMYPGFGESLRHSLFQVSSLMTTTGFASDDFDQWPHLSKLLLVTLMFFGGCAGSTGGGLKHVRLLLLWRHLRIQFYQLVHPKAVKSIKLDGKKVPEEVTQAVLGFFFLYLLVFLLASLIVCALGLDIITGVSAVAATLNNIGPGLAGVGPMAHFGHLPDLSKGVLMVCMLAGRLELFTVIVLFFPLFWRESRRPVLRWEKK
jgi:trk system potassium uptake protein TrkH